MTPNNTFFSNTRLAIYLTLGGFAFLLNGAIIVKDLFHIGISIAFSMGCYVIALYYVMKDESKNEQWNRGLNRTNE